MPLRTLRELFSRLDWAYSKASAKTSIGGNLNLEKSMVSVPAKSRHVQLRSLAKALNRRGTSSWKVCKGVILRNRILYLIKYFRQEGSDRRSRSHRYHRVPRTKYRRVPHTTYHVPRPVVREGQWARLFGSKKKKKKQSDELRQTHVTYNGPNSTIQVAERKSRRNAKMRLTKREGHHRFYRAVDSTVSLLRTPIIQNHLYHLRPQPRRLPKPTLKKLSTLPKPRLIKLKTPKTHTLAPAPRSHDELEIVRAKGDGVDGCVDGGVQPRV